MPWWGWGKKRRRDIWRRIVGTFESIGECSRRLGAEGDRLGIPAHFQVMTGRAPPPDLATHQPAAVGLSDAETTSDSSA